VVSVTDTSGRISRFSRQKPLLFYQVAPQFVLTRLSAPRSRPATFFFFLVLENCKNYIGLFIALNILPKAFAMLNKYSILANRT
jgi:hypothetical protein